MFGYHDDIIIHDVSTTISDTFLQDFLEILKYMLLNLKKILMKCSILSMAANNLVPYMELLVSNELNINLQLQLFIVSETWKLGK